MSEASEKNEESIYEQSLALHSRLGGKIEIRSRAHLESQHDLSLSYTPGVAAVCQKIAREPEAAYTLTMKKNSVAVISDGSAVLGLGNIGATAAIPVMEGKAILFKRFAGIDAFPLCLRTQNTDEIIHIIQNLAPSFGGINLEDISAPRCFEIEERLQQIGIPVFHDDQHGTAVVLLAGLLNAAKLAKKSLSEMRVVINGSGAAGTAIAYLLLNLGKEEPDLPSVRDVIVCDSKGIISRKRMDIENNPAKARLALVTNLEQKEGSLEDAILGCDVFIGVSKAGLLKASMIAKMQPEPIIFALANPIPEIMPKEAKQAGAFVIATGRSDFPNQVNNVLAFPGIFRGAIDARARSISEKMKIAAARALADFTSPLSVDKILPSPLEDGVCEHVARSVYKAAIGESPA